MRHGMRCCRSKSRAGGKATAPCGAVVVMAEIRVPEATAADKKVAGVNSIYAFRGLFCVCHPVNIAPPGSRMRRKRLIRATRFGGFFAFVIP
ncbi:hypothetical protein PUATCC27989T_04502 [Phytobacter ursingii]|nr:hypothetical protein PUATCC27989T_04502 [Phytobacter ursingii]